MCVKVRKIINPQIRNVRVVCSIHIIGSKLSKAYRLNPVSLFYWCYANATVLGNFSHSSTTKIHGGFHGKR